MGKEEMKAFRQLKERMISRVKSWKQNTFTRQIEVFIKSILQAIPTYIMSYFLLLKTLCKEFDSIINNYWWKHNQRQHGVHWMNWQKMCTSKTLGGLGFRNMAQFNIVMICKQGWRCQKVNFLVNCCYISLLTIYRIYRYKKKYFRTLFLAYTTYMAKLTVDP